MIESSTPNWPPFLWHHRVHTDIAGERLVFYRIPFGPLYERDVVEAGIRAACARHGVRSIISYELFGAYDVLLRVWLPRVTDAASFRATLMDELEPAGAQVIEPFAVDYTLRHFLFPASAGEPAVQDVAHLQIDEIREVESIDTTDVSTLIERLGKQRLLATFPRTYDEAPDKQGIKFAIAVTSEARLSREQLIKFERAIERVVDAATGVRERSMYSGFGFAHFLIMGRVGYAQYHELHRQLIAQINAAAVREPYRVKTQTHLSGRRGYQIAAEGLSGLYAEDDQWPLVVDAPLPLEPDDVSPGDTIDKRFEVRARLGSGGYALVFRAYDKLERVDRAIKLFRSRDPAAARREMDALRKVKHRNVVRLVDDGHDGDMWYLVFELVRGQSLAQVSLPLEPRQALRIIDQVLEALIALHPDDDRIAELDELGREGNFSDEQFAERQRLRDSGLIHRDIKPGNIMLGADELVTLVDFNISSPARRPTITRTSTPEYSPPDAGQGGWEPADDLFACGVVLYEILAGRHPYYDDDDCDLEHPIDITERCPDLPEGLVQIVRQAMSESRVDRYATAKAMQSDIRAQLRTVRRAGTDAQAIGHTLETRRTELGMSRRDLSRKTGIPEEEIERVENGEAVLGFTDAKAITQELLMRLDQLRTPPDSESDDEDEDDGFAGVLSR